MARGGDPSRARPVAGTADSEIQFFSDESAWRIAVRLKYPRARFETHRGIHRAYLRHAKVAAFGRLPGYGVVLSENMAKQLYRSKRVRGG